MVKGQLKKQSQFEPGMIGVTSYLKGDYDKIPLCGAQKNKAKQSQYYRSALALSERGTLYAARIGL
jgi:hypothetical protein